MAPRINEKLYFCRLLLDRADGADAATVRALTEGAVWHLATAYRCHLAELMAAHKTSPRPEESMANAGAARLARWLEASGWRVPEVDELAVLEQRGGWPAALLAACDALTDLSPPNGSSATAAGPLLASTADGSVAPATVRAWLTSFETLLAVQRTTLQEW